jgi:hypothetical protein
MHTGWLLPGSLTVASCSSLYFLKAGVSLATVCSETVKDLISACMASMKLESSIGSRVELLYRQ